MGFVRKKIWLLMTAAVLFGFAAFTATFGNNWFNNRGSLALTGSSTSGIFVSRSLSPEVSYFGDTVEARLFVVVNKKTVDEKSVKVKAKFKPYEQVGSVKTSRQKYGSDELLSFVYKIRCLKDACLPLLATKAIVLPKVVVGYLYGKNRNARQLELTWPLLVVSSRLSRADVDTLNFKADPDNMLGITYKVKPWMVYFGLFALAGILTVVAAFIFSRTKFRWEKQVLAFKPESPVVLTPLQILEMALLGEVVPEAKLRWALDDLCLKLKSVERSDLALSLKGLAWSESPVLSGRETLKEVARVLKEGRQ